MILFEFINVLDTRHRHLLLCETDLNRMNTVSATPLIERLIMSSSADDKWFWLLLPKQK